MYDNIEFVFKIKLFPVKCVKYTLRGLVKLCVWFELVAFGWEDGYLI